MDPDERDLDDRAAGAPRRRVLVYSAAALAVLLVGAAIGMLVTLTAVGSDAPPGEGSVDVGFSQDMRTHHLQAITMAGIARDRTTDPEVKGLAFDIETGQLDQSGQMSGWLTSWNQPTLPPPGQKHMRWMAAGGHDHGGMAMSPDGVDRMPGMASTEELTKLRSLTGREFDVYFLQLMLRHHDGGQDMAAYGADHAQLAYVRNLAEKIKTAQGKEIELLTDMLRARGAQPLPDN
ncbi:hypothetical protein BJP25_26630 [Actinokineospora bangkokensis]|uniref:DUF305 domain-containing protein n=1 Tax=Actinokineospora bangkokensis TaxID=1193682 RepID=A0A1Q9LH64_9PSEU|nr:hypothetical protein BJP25_26630 [Actinokineospora bangkokensis]